MTLCERRSHAHLTADVKHLPTVSRGRVLSLTWRCLRDLGLNYLFPFAAFASLATRRTACLASLRPERPVVQAKGRPKPPFVFPAADSLSAGRLGRGLSA